MATSAGAWRKKGVAVTLPSGNVAILRKLDPFSLILDNGKIPDVLSPFVARMVAGGGGGDAGQPDPKYIESAVSIFNKVAKVAFVEPRVEDVASDDALTLEEITFADKSFVFTWLMGGQETVDATFQAPQQSG